jgi:ankyrin repeat protein
MSAFKNYLFFIFFSVFIQGIYSANVSTPLSQEIFEMEAQVGEEGEASNLLHSSGVGDIDGIINSLDNGENLDVVNVNGWSPAMFAVGGGHLDALRLLIDNGVDLNIATVDGLTPLMLAVQQVLKFPTRFIYCTCLFKGVLNLN